ncbi:unnamed protein product [Phytophthora lilii]|uniref:Unnamed protein product n=1 Tax=Phytophthora lilii TaxID=2077276 RepID=A0A9W6X462_9STRA|nr:unnamed protein product [Phytophthora lilii]
MQTSNIVLATQEKVVVNDDGDKERMMTLASLKDKDKAALTAARLTAAQSDDMASIAAKLKEKGEINVLFKQIEELINKLIPDFKAGSTEI